MGRYYVNTWAEENGGHEVHAAKCGHMAKPGYRIHLGDFRDCRDAVQEAKKRYAEAEGCKLCCRACYTTRTESTGPASDSMRRGAPLHQPSFGG